MATIPPILKHLLNFEILIKYKETIRQLINYIRIDILTIIKYYKFNYSLIYKVLNYKALKKVRLIKIKRFHLLNNL